MPQFDQFMVTQDFHDGGCQGLIFFYIEHAQSCRIDQLDNTIGVDNEKSIRHVGQNSIEFTAIGLQRFDLRVSLPDQAVESLTELVDLLKII